MHVEEEETQINNQNCAIYKMKIECSVLHDITFQKWAKVTF